MRRLGPRGGTLAKGMAAAAGLALFAWWFVSGLAICPSVGDLSPPCRAEADRIGLKAAAIVGAFVALVTVMIVLNKRIEGAE